MRGELCKLAIVSLSLTDRCLSRIVDFSVLYYFCALNITTFATMSLAIK